MMGGKGGSPGGGGASLLGVVVGSLIPVAFLAAWSAEIAWVDNLRDTLPVGLWFRLPFIFVFGYGSFCLTAVAVILPLCWLLDRIEGRP